jgi:L-arabinose isomerase
MRSRVAPARAAFVGFGEVNSPKETINEMCAKAYQDVNTLGLDLVTTGPVTDDPQGNDVRRAIKALEEKDFDLLILCIAGWIPSHAVITVSERFRDKPMILWGLSGEVKNGHIVTMAPQAGTTALRKVFEDLTYRFRYVYNVIGKPAPLQRIRSYATAVAVAKSLHTAKVGMMGYRDMRLYNTLYEALSLKVKFGVEVDFFEMLEMVQMCEKVDNKEAEVLVDKIKKEWIFEKPVPDKFLSTAAHYYLAIRSIAEAHQFNAISLKDVDGMKKLLHFPPAMIFMLLADEMRLCTIPENDVMGAVTQLIVSQATGQSAAYLEFYEFLEKGVLMGVPDFVPADVVEGKVRVTSASFGQIDGGLLNISTMKTGRLTLARLSNTADQYSMHICTGEGRLRSWEEAGWSSPAPQLPSLEILLDVPLDDFAQKVSGQHYIIAYGDQSEILYDFCHLKDIRVL